MEQKPLAIPQAIPQGRGAANANLSALASAQTSAQRSLSPAVKRSAEDEKVCWIEVKQYPYQPDHQVELLHLQAEADALLIKLQAREQARE